MTNLNKFKSRLVSDKGLQKKMSEASTIKDVVKIAKSVGCDVTENEVKDDMMKAISGGIGDGDINGHGALSTNTNTVGHGSVGVTASTGDISFSLVDLSHIISAYSQSFYGNDNHGTILGNSTITTPK